MIRSLLESDALASLSKAARRCLDRILLEHLDHAGKENGGLPVTYSDFEAFGVRHASIKAALTELEASGIIECVKRGRGGYGEYRRPSVFRLTFLPTKEGGPTHEWRTFVPQPTRDIDSRPENEPGSVGPDLGLKTPHYQVRKRA
jgi:hypothetical protein